MNDSGGGTVRVFTLVVVLAAVVATSTGAWGQTTSTTSASTTTVPSTSTTASTTTTLPLPECVTPGGCPTDASRLLPPEAYLTSTAGERRAVGLSFTWCGPSPSGLQGCTHGDVFFLSNVPEPLLVQQGEVLTLHFDPALAPSELHVGRREISDRLGVPYLDAVSVPAANPTQFGADFPLGTWDLVVNARFDQGGASYLIRITVKAETPRPARLQLTG